MNFIHLEKQSLSKFRPKEHSLFCQRFTADDFMGVHRIPGFHCIPPGVIDIPHLWCVKKRHKRLITWVIWLNIYEVPELHILCLRSPEYLEYLDSLELKKL